VADLGCSNLPGELVIFLAQSDILQYNVSPDGFLGCRSGLPFARNTVPRRGLEVLPKFWLISG
jgi:hypothetical protein